MRELLEDSFRAAVAAANPLQILPAHLPPPPAGRTFVAGAGKAAATMALAVEKHWPADAPLEGIALTRYGHGLETSRIRVIEASHPIPDEAGEKAAREILESVRALGPDDRLLALVSGGGSALLSLPADGVPMVDLKNVTSQLLRCGAAIQEINTVRKHLSAIQGGQLALACRAPVLALIVSDVTGDDPTHIASGPCSPDPTTFAESLAVLAKYSIEAPLSVRWRLESGAEGRTPETPKPGDPALRHVETRVIGTAHRSLEAAAKRLRNGGVTAVVLSDSITGEAAEVAKVMAALAREVRTYGSPWRPRVALLSGGECTVTVRAERGRGGRCAEFLLALAIELEGVENVWAIAADTDGIDGTEDNAGAILTPDTLARARAAGLDPKQNLASNDSYGFFSALGDLVVTGPTRTNVNDYRAILIA
ncbi:MAG TPA: glycerate kinase [Burkholderiales bacterium]|jgi:hydroxypyruvate reductase|nr:glycerate kinase [Burkholderiales bacterium]